MTPLVVRGREYRVEHNGESYTLHGNRGCVHFLVPLDQCDGDEDCFQVKTYNTRRGIITPTWFSRVVLVLRQGELEVCE